EARQGQAGTVTAPTPVSAPTTAPAPAALTVTVAAATPAATAVPTSPPAAAGGGASATVAPVATAAPAPAPAGAAPTTGASAASAQPALASGAGAQRYAIVPETSKATYRVGEIFFNQGNRYNVAIGTTNAISGDLYIDRTRPSASRIDPITVDISQLASDSGRRDGAIRREWLESSKFPNATFTTKRLEGLPDGYTEGQELRFKIVGDMAIRTVTKELTFDAVGKLQGDTFTGTATTGFNMTDFGFDPPDIFGTLKAENAVALELTIEAKRAP
ncbi:MAG: hypothetical protein AVDCRST_MAG88-4375, partial [uncultured Thermomicrobiales bacterium]